MLVHNAKNLFVEPTHGHTSQEIVLDVIFKFDTVHHGGDLIQDQETFKLFTLGLLFSGNEVSIPEIKLLKDTYLNVISRRKNLDVDLMYQSESSIENMAIGHLVYSRFNSCISSIKELSIYIQKVMGIK